MTGFEEYKEEVIADIEQTVTRANCQPVIFAGTGLSIRYFGAPNWDGLLERLVKDCDGLEEEYGFYRQTRSPTEVGQFLAEKYAEWAWSDYGGYDSDEESEFLGWDEELFDHENKRDIFLKAKIADHIRKMTPETVDDLAEDTVHEKITLDAALREVKHLQEIQPHAVITTNYDRFFEAIFNEEVSDDNLLDDDRVGSAGFNRDEEIDPDDIPSYRVVVGEQVLRTRYRNIGEILHIHGSVSNPESIVLTEDDYHEFNNRRRYLSSKMLTYFAEHPLLIVGYRPDDPNVQQVLTWADEVLSDERSITEDIYFLQWVENAEEENSYPREHDIKLDDGGHLRVKNIVADDFGWVFRAFAEGDELAVDPRYLRSLLAQTYDVVSSMSSGGEVVDINRLEDVATDVGELRTVLGYMEGEPGEVPPIKFQHTYRPSEVAEEIGLDSYVTLNREILDQIEEDRGVDITAFNNRYHIAFFEESGVEPRRYSDEALDLFKKVKDGQDYSLDIPEERIPN
ncbi:hypothetical protein C491_20941 [Natronococcus amylolyticus DSM 10524]|uniref:Uncharacterized protein n=1 Tax=Natronococcus amylolyticus DSM 10524 TaxID=1227497 RepID=L9WWT5_9EURY|nr:SIR2 family protein [Natronococcus amylolyticus]ELY53646.1 hypothetical protein C491_20941 [Natronococcus amylolyticus DSM 10524]